MNSKFEQGLLKKKIVLFNFDGKPFASGRLVSAERYLYVLDTADRGRIGIQKHATSCIQEVPKKTADV